MPIVTGPSPAFQPQPQENPMEQFGRLMALKNQMQMAPLQQQAMQQQVQAGQLENQQRQVQIKDQQAMTAAMQNWDGKDYNDLVPLVQKHGGSAQAVLGLKSKILEQQQALSTIAKNNGEGAKAQIDAVKTKGDLLNGALSTLLQTPDQQLPQAVVQTAQDLVQRGVLDPQHAQMAAQLAQSGNIPQMRQQLDLLRKSNLAQSQMMDEALKAAQTDEANARAKEANINAALAPQKASIDQAYKQAELKQGQQRIGIEGARLKFEQQKAGMDGSGAPNDLAQAIAQGHITPDRMGYLLARNPEILQGVLKVDPSFDSSKAQAYPQVYKDFTSGKTAVALNAGATALGHLKELADMNTNASHIPGTADYNAYQNKADTVSSELAKFYGDATIPAIAAIKKTLTATLPGNRQAAIKTQAQSMADKLDAFQQQWDNAAPSKAYQAPMPGISAKAQAARSALAGDSQGPSVPPEGTVKTNSHGDRIVVKGGKWQLAQ